LNSALEISDDEGKFAKIQGIETGSHKELLEKVKNAQLNLNNPKDPIIEKAELILRKLEGLLANPSLDEWLKDHYNNVPKSDIEGAKDALKTALEKPESERVNAINTLEQNPKYKKIFETTDPFDLISISSG